MIILGPLPRQSSDVTGNRWQKTAPFHLERRLKHPLPPESRLRLMAHAEAPNQIESMEKHLLRCSFALHLKATPLFYFLDTSKVYVFHALRHSAWKMAVQCEL